MYKKIQFLEKNEITFTYKYEKIV